MVYRLVHGNEPISEDCPMPDGSACCAAVWDYYWVIPFCSFVQTVSNMLVHQAWGKSSENEPVSEDCPMPHGPVCCAATARNCKKEWLKSNLTQLKQLQVTLCSPMSFGFQWWRNGKSSLVNMQWSFELVQGCWQMSMSIENIERWYYFLLLLQILLWTNSNIK